MSEKLELCVSEAQLRPGMMVETRGCKTCGRQKCRVMLTSRQVRIHTHIDRPGLCPAKTGWSFAGCDNNPACFHYAIQERRLFIVDVGDTRDLHEVKKLERTE